MGFTAYCSSSRSVRAETEKYSTGSLDQIFTQQKERKAHATMLSQGVTLRECRDSETHPNTIPIVLGLDVTGSMRSIPRQLIADGLPTLMTTLIQRGLDDASLLFLAIGDHECDHYPVQVGQFESGDAELDMWLTRTYLEGGGGGNAGESYPLAWEFVSRRVQTDAWDKRKQKGFLFTIGDEPFLKSFPERAFKEIYGPDQMKSVLTAQELYDAACEKFNVFHISVDHSYRKPDEEWTELLGQNHLVVTDFTTIPTLIAETILNVLKVKPKKIAESAIEIEEDALQPML